MSKLKVLEEHLASMQMNYNAKYLGRDNREQSLALRDIKELKNTICILHSNTKECVISNCDLSNIKVHFDEVKPDSKSILTKLFNKFKN